MKKLQIVGLVCLILIVFGAGIWTGGTLIGTTNDASPQAPPGSPPDFQLIAQAWDITQKNYVDQTAVQPQRLTYGAIGGMIDSLGDTGHSTFLTPEELKQLGNYEQGQIEGIGLEVQQKSGSVVVVAPIEGSPAQKAGIRSGDIILKVNGQAVADVSDAVQKILGPPGSSVTVTIQTASGAVKDFTIVRAKITITSVDWAQLPGTPFIHLRISAFSKDTTTELDKALRAINPLKPAGIILDLRDNPGGLLDQAIEVASRFIKSGNVLEVKNVQGRITAVPVASRGSVVEIPIVVLINQGSASAAEIVAGALQDNGRAKLAGEKTFGTGTVLNEFPLSDGSALLLATEEWLTPSGKTIWHTGLVPDQTIPLPANATPLFPAAEKGLTAEQLQSSGDLQLLSGLNFLAQK